ncbi:multidrug/biocide efflux PACE transporter [Bordetella sp. FB-8]|uniref:multidrug/biocide efflux PACE transporter n=1 Tax=Bordetella sp. FB-8 TaxID=1159870 RepID=UPI000371E5EB|nr:multidrug/biocide efflux PACE transporter [Bordetella sp. FB-8]
MKRQNKSLLERFIHALGFEVLLLALSAPLGAWLLGRPMTQVGMLSVIISITAMLWNMAYNAAFDRLWPVSRVARTVRVRALHACGFEGGLALVCVPLTAFALDFSLIEAFMVEVGLLLFILPYTMAYNGIYDAARARWIARGRILGTTGR